MKELTEFIQWWYSKDFNSQYYLYHLNGFTVSIMLSWIAYLVAMIVAAWNDEFEFKTMDDTIGSVIALALGFVLFTLAGCAFFFLMPCILPLMFMVGICMLTIGAKKLHFIKQEKKTLN